MNQTDEKDMTEKVKEYRLLNAQLTRLAHARGQVRQQIRAEMSASGLAQVSAGDYTVRTFTVARRHFDVAAFRKDHPELAEQYTVTTDVRRFSVE
ncbi:MAG: hypothetical protein IJW30_04130 [Clostridia bacterium]|nr:hypothetical protein [Clostridia bacterium]